MFDNGYATAKRKTRAGCVAIRVSTTY